MDIKKFSKLSPKERMLWSLSYGWFIYENLPESKKKIFQKYRNRWKKHLKKES
jgi:hypothetical protein